MLAFVGRVSGGGGYVLVECDDPKTIHAFVGKFIFWNDCEVVPVLDVAESAASAAAALAWARGAAGS